MDVHSYQHQGARLLPILKDGVSAAAKEMIITTEWLKERGACADQVELFGRTFGDGADMTPTNITSAAAAGLDLDWFAKVVLPAPARAEYVRATVTARAEFSMLAAPALAEYRRIEANAWDEFQRATAPALAEYERVRATAWAEYLRVRATAWAEYLRAMAPALIGILWPEAAGEGGAN